MRRFGSTPSQRLKFGLPHGSGNRRSTRQFLDTAGTQRLEVDRDVGVQVCGIVRTEIRRDVRQPRGVTGKVQQRDIAATARRHLDGAWWVLRNRIGQRDLAPLGHAREEQ